MATTDNLSWRRHYHPLALGPAGEMKLLASVTAIGAQVVGGALGDQQRIGFGRVAGFFAADA